jgi:hypothetical protein
MILILKIVTKNELLFEGYEINDELWLWHDKRMKNFNPKIFPTKNLNPSRRDAPKESLWGLRHKLQTILILHHLPFLHKVISNDIQMVNAFCQTGNI